MRTIVAFTYDRYACTLHGIMEGKFSAKWIFKSDETFQKVQDAVTKLRKGVPSKRARIEASFPSPSDYGKGQETPKLHVSLQVEAFGHFMDQLNIAIEDNKIAPKFYDVATRLMKVMSTLFLTEHSRQNAFLDEIRDLFPSPHVGAGERLKSDTTMTQIEVNQQTYNVINWEFQNGSNPIRGNNGYLVHLQSDRQDRSPMLLATVIGCDYLQIFGAVWNGSVECADPLCSPVSLLLVPRDPLNGVSKVAHVLAALHDTVDKLKEYYSLPTVHRTRNEGPYFCLDGLEGMEQIGNWMFEGEYNGENVVVKFSRFHYGTDVHYALAEQQLAPQLKYTERLASNWHVVVMEKIDHYECL